MKLFNMKLSPALSGCAKQNNIVSFFSFYSSALGAARHRRAIELFEGNIKNPTGVHALAVGFDKCAQGACYYLSSWAIGNMGFG